MASKRTEEELILEAKARYNRCEEWESRFRENYLYDTKFAEGDSTNMYQWDSALVRSRQATNRPCLTNNKTKIHCRQIINDQRQNQSQIEIRPVSNGATYQAARIFEDVVRYIEYQSNAQAAYSNATYSQVIGGIGYWRILCDYAHDDSFDQDIKIQRIADPMTVYLDPDISEYDGSDARFAFVFKDMPKKDYEDEYGDIDDVGNNSPLGEGSSDGWIGEDHVRVAEYYRKVYDKDILHELDNGTLVKESHVKAQERKLQKLRNPEDESMLDTLKRVSVRTRDITTPRIEWYLIAGSKIIDKKDWPGVYIPIVRLIGEETVIDKELDRKGHVRSLIDPQRIYNYWSSGAVEAVALVGKTPYIAPAEAIEGYEEEWASANTENKAFLPWNSVNDAGQPIPAPQRAAPAQMPPAYISGLQIAQQEMMMVSGQYEANLGQKSNEVSGRAVMERRRQGDNATYHFIDHFSQALTFTGKILVDLIPKIFDVERVIKILGVDQKQRTVKVDPNHPDAHQQVQDEEDDDNYNPQDITAIWNPNIGKYAVVADIGPAFETKRQETASALMQLMGQNKELAAVAGDLFFQSSDFYLADTIARRLKNMVPEKALGKDTPDPQVQQLQQMLAKQHEVMSDQSQQLNEAKLKAVQKDPNLEWYKAETDRLSAVGKIDPQALMPIVRELVSQVLGTPANPVIAAHAAENANMPQTAQAPIHPIDMAHDVNMQQMSQDHQANLQQNAQSAAADMQMNQQAANQQNGENG